MLVLEKEEKCIVSIISSDKILVKHKIGYLGDSLPRLPRERHLIHLVPDRLASHVYHRDVLSPLQSLVQIVPLLIEERILILFLVPDCILSCVPSCIGKISVY